MNNYENPYRASGTFTGISYIKRNADKQLINLIEKNQRFPYIIAPRQSGKSSLINNTILNLNKTRNYYCIFIDLSDFPLSTLQNYDQFLLLFSEELLSQLEELNITTHINQKNSLKSLIQEVSKSISKQLIIFIDEVDVLLNKNFKDDFFGLIRSFFNQRSRNNNLEKIQFVLSGAAQPRQLIINENSSPFNVGEAIKLDNLLEYQIEKMVSYFYYIPKDKIQPISSQIYLYTNGSVYLTQLILEKLWDTYSQENAKTFDLTLVDNIVDSIIQNSSQNSHFVNIHSSLIKNPFLLQSFHNYEKTGHINPLDYENLEIIGIIDSNQYYKPYQNLIYKIIFSYNGQLSLFDSVNTSKSSFQNQVGTSLLPIFQNYKENLISKISAAYNQIDISLSEIDKLRIQRHINSLESELAELNSKINSLNNPNKHNLPERNRFFTGRVDVLNQLSDLIKSNLQVTIKQALSGMGGVGKTQTALEFCYIHIDDYQTILWITAENEISFNNSYYGVVDLLNLAPSSSNVSATSTSNNTIVSNEALKINEVISLVKRWLANNSNWLMVLDNLEDPKLINQYLPSNHQGHILITTRSQSLKGQAAIVQLKKMSNETGTLFLLKRANLIPIDSNDLEQLKADNNFDNKIIDKLIGDAQKIVQAMDGLPLALEQAGAYIQESGCSLADYFKAYQDARNTATILDNDAEDANNHQTVHREQLSQLINVASFNSQLEEFVKKHDSLRRMLDSFFCKKGLPPQEVEDLTSEVINILYQKVSNKDSEPIKIGIQAYAFGIARNLRANTYEKLLKEPQPLEDIKSSYLLQENYLDNKLDKEKYLYYIQKCANELNLSLTDRLIVFNDNSDNDDELAKKIGWSVENVRTRRYRFRKQIIEYVRKHLKLEK